MPMGRTVGSRWATPARPLRTACGVAAAGVYVLTRLRLATAGTPSVLPDSFDYARVEHLSLLDPRFYEALKPFGLPLLWKLVPGPDTVAGAQVTFTGVGPVVVAQTLVSAAAWLLLAWSVASLCRSPRAKTAAASAVLVFSLSSAVTDWDGA